MALTTAAQVKQFLSITTATEDSFFDIVLPAVEAEVKIFLDRDIESQSYVDYYGGNGTRVLCLNEYPVTSVTDVREDAQGYFGSVTNSFGTDTVLVSGEDYVLAKDGRNQLAEVGRLIRLNGVWPCRYEWKRGLLTAAVKPGIGNIKVTYTAGYAANAIPKDLQMGIWLLVAQIRLARKRGGMVYSGESLAEYSYSLQQMAKEQLELGTAAQLLSRYRRIRSRHKVLT